MIQANELRIGNWIKTPEQEEKVYDNFFDTDEGVRFINDWNISVIKPIQLTEEWLIKFGYNVKRETNLDGLYEFHRWQLTGDSKDRDRNMITHDRTKNQFTIWDDLKVIANLRRNHVHTLQNLYFALTGEELTTK